MLASGNRGGAMIEIPGFPEITIHWVILAAIATSLLLLATLIFFVLRRWITAPSERRRFRPFRITPKVGQEIALRHFLHQTDQGNFGEALTAILYTVDGWRQVTTDGKHAIDGLFVRDIVDRSGFIGFEIAFTESKTGTAELTDHQLTTEHLVKKIEELRGRGVFGDEEAVSICGGLSRGSPYITRRLWIHRLHDRYSIEGHVNEEGVVVRTERTTRTAPIIDSMKNYWDLHRTSVQKATRGEEE